MIFKLFQKSLDSSSSCVLQSSLDSISKWCNDWQLHLSPSKCAVLSISSKSVKYCYKINNTALEHVLNFTDLGVIVDSSLSFETHINSFCTKARQRSDLILKCFTSRDPFLLIRAFTTYVRPLLEYASAVWSPSKIHLIDKLESVQRRFTKRLKGLSHMSYETRLSYLRVESLELRRHKSDLTLYFKILHNCIEMDAKTFFSLSNSTRTRGHSFKLLKPVCRTNLQLSSFSCRAINSWNSLPDDIVESTNLHTFKSKLNTLSPNLLIQNL